MMWTRREMLARCANGFGWLAWTALASANNAFHRDPRDPMRVRQPHFAPRARSVIFLFMDGGVSHVDTFDPKPRLRDENGKPIPLKLPTTGNGHGSPLFGSPWEFRKYGQSGLEVSDLFPHVARCADDLAVIRSMVSDHTEHTAGNYFMHSGSALQGRPSIGAWVTYGLGSPSRNLPGFVVMDTGMIPPGGLDLFGSGFLPASYQGLLFRKGEHPVADIAPRDHAGVQRGKLDLLRRLDERSMESFAGDTKVEAAIANYELAFRMQSEVPDLLSLRGESETTKKLYGIDQPDTQEFGTACLLARRMVERGVRFVELLSPKRTRVDRWDQHNNIVSGHGQNAKATDQPIAALIRDLKSRGMLDETLLIWGGEFGRTPTGQGSAERGLGRDHHPYGFTMWMAGGGIKGGTVYGATDEYGYYAVENKVHVHDLHATALHLLGIDHKKLTYPFSGRDMRLTDVHGHVVGALLA
jgi:hypothetical protein